MWPIKTWSAYQISKRKVLKSWLLVALTVEWWPWKQYILFFLSHESWRFLLFTRNIKHSFQQTFFISTLSLIMFLARLFFSAFQYIHIVYCYYKVNVFSYVPNMLMFADPSLLCTPSTTSTRAQTWRTPLSYCMLRLALRVSPISTRHCRRKPLRGGSAMCWGTSYR